MSKILKTIELCNECTHCTFSYANENSKPQFAICTNDTIEAFILIHSPHDSAKNYQLEIHEECPLENYNSKFKRGWIKIESDADLPRESNNYWIINKLGISMRGYDMQDHNYWEDVTHYQTIIKPQPPIY